MRTLRSILLLLAVLSGFSAARAEALTLPAGFGDSTVATGISSPTAMAIAPDGRIFVCQQSGALRVIQNGTLLPTPFVTVSTTANGERGLLGVAFHPAFPTTPHVFVYYTVSTSPPHNRVSRFTADPASPNVALAGSELVLVELDNLSAATNHNGGAIHFGPDGRLYVAVGENATPSNAQTLANRHGKILRYEADGTIPTDNPFFATASGANRAIWALGLRNPFTFGFEPGTARLFVNDVGAGTWEEVNDGIAGSNYGWPTCEGNCSPPNPSFRNPIHQYPHPDGCAIAGGAFYRPPVSQFPASYQGAYFFADLCGGWIRRLDPANGNVVGFATGLANPVDLQVGPDGLLYALDYGLGSVVAIQYTDAPAITEHPTDRSVLLGQTATFTVGASGAPPLAYQWKRNGVPIGGATAASYTTPPAIAADHGTSYRSAVTNTFGGTESNAATLSVTSNTPPVPTITSPTSRVRYRAGGTLSFAGGARDAEDGVLPASAFSWTIVFHHDTHTHPFAGPIDDVTSGSVAIPDRGETATNVFLRVHLTVTDSAGAQGTTFVDVLPQTVLLQLRTSPVGLQLTLDGQPFTSPLSVQSVVGMRRTIGAPSPQTLGVTRYEFRIWSDRGAQTHEIVTPARGKTYTARYRVTTTP